MTRMTKVSPGRYTHSCVTHCLFEDAMPLFGNRKHFEKFGLGVAKNDRKDRDVVEIANRRSRNNCESPPSTTTSTDVNRSQQKSNSNDGYFLRRTSPSLKSICASISMLTSAPTRVPSAAAPASALPTTQTETAAATFDRAIVTTENEKPKLLFHCQQAQGSPTGLISGFSNVKELYEKIAECFDFTPDQILFCTLNTHKIDMNKLLGGQIGLDDFIFVHRKGRAKEIEIEKSDDALGLTITDNGTGYAFIKRVKEGSLIDRVQHIQVGDHIEKINEESMIGRRHYEVAQRLKDIAKDSAFTLRLVEPIKAGFSNVEPRRSDIGSRRAGAAKRDYGSGTETLRFKANGSVRIEKAPNDLFRQGIESINQLLENFLGINDDELAARIWEAADGKTNSVQFAETIDNSDLEELAFTDDFIIELWGAITDVRAGRRSQRYRNDNTAGDNIPEFGKTENEIPTIVR